MPTLAERIDALPDDAIVEACKNLKLGLQRELRQRGDQGGILSNADVRQAFEALPVDAAAAEARSQLLDPGARDTNSYVGRALLHTLAGVPEFTAYVEGAVQGAETGVRAIDPVSVLSIAAAVYLVGRLMPHITITRPKQTIEIKPLDDPLKGLSDLVKAIPVFRTK